MIIKASYPALMFLVLIAIHAQATPRCNFIGNDTAMAQCNYSRFSVLLSCKDNLALLSYTENLNSDEGNENTSNRNHYLDESANALNCQQTSNNNYNSQSKGFDLGYLTAIDLFDDNISHALETNVMTNMVPQASKFNRIGAWKRTETYVECYRDNKDAPISVYSGVIIGSDITNDHFNQSHGLPRTPDYLFRIIFSKTENSYDAWLMENNNTSNVASIKSFRRNITQIIAVLKQQPLSDKAAYKHVIYKLNEINETAPRQIELTYNNQCRSKVG